jgi:hypothetical protein
VRFLTNRVQADGSPYRIGDDDNDIMQILLAHACLSNATDLIIQLMKKGAEPSVELLGMLSRTGQNPSPALMNALRSAPVRETIADTVVNANFATLMAAKQHGLSHAHPTHRGRGRGMRYTIFEIENAKDMTQWIGLLEDLVDEDEDRLKAHNKKIKRKSVARSLFIRTLKKWIGASGPASGDRRLTLLQTDTSTTSPPSAIKRRLLERRPRRLPRRRPSLTRRRSRRARSPRLRMSPSDLRVR